MTSGLVLLPDIEQLVVSFALEQTELDSLGGRIYTELPRSKTFPAARVHQFTDQQVSEPVLWLMRYSLQIDVWGGPKKLTRTIADTMRALFAARLVGIHDQGVVTDCRIGGLDTTPDDSLPTDDGKARPRSRFDLTAWAHPLPSSVGS